jgi:hypothetical protein
MSIPSTPYNYCCNYDCCEKLDTNADNLYFDDDFAYCSYACAFDHYYDRKKQRKSAFYTASGNHSVADAHKIATQAVKESVRANQQSKAEMDTRVCRNTRTSDVAVGTD